MSEAVIMWVLGGFGLALLTLGKLLWSHIDHCKSVHAKLAEISTDVKHVISDIGTHETGLRGTVHKTANRVTEIDMRVAVIERREGGR